MFSKITSISAAMLVMGSVLGMSSPASAGLTTFFGIDQGSGSPPTAAVNSLTARNAFLATFANTGVENFDSMTANVAPASSLSFPSTGITASFSTAAGEVVANTSSLGAFATSGTNYLFNSGSGGTNDTVAFNTAVAGFGLYVTDLNDGTSPADQLQLILTLTGSGGQQTVETTMAVNNNNGNLFFFGVASTDPTQLISSIQILNTVPNAGDALGIDDMTIGTNLATLPSSVPEPITLSVFGAGVACAAAMRRRKKARRFQPSRTEAAP